MSKRILFLLIPFIMLNTFLSGQTVSFNYWNDASWSGTLQVQYWIEMNGNRTLLSHFENGIQPTEIDQDIKLIVEFKDLQLGFKKGKLRGKDHDKYFFLECSISASFQNAESSGLAPLFERPIRLQEGGKSVYLPFIVFPNVLEQSEITLKTGFIIRHDDFPEEGWPTNIEKSFIIRPNSSLLDQEMKSREAKRIFAALTTSNEPIEDQVKMMMCDQLINDYSSFLSGRELQEVRTIKKEMSDKLPDLPEKEMYELIQRNIKNGLTNEAVNQAKTYLMHLSANQYKGHYREDVIFTIINESKRVDEVSAFITLYRRDYPTGRYLDQLMKAQQKVRMRNSGPGIGQTGLEGISNSDLNLEGTPTGQNDIATEMKFDTSKASISFLLEKQSIHVSVFGSSNALMLRIVDRISQKGWNAILPPDKDTYEVDIWNDQEFAQLPSGLYSAQLSKVLPDTTYSISNEIMFNLERPLHIPKVIYYLGALFVILSGFGFYQKYLKL